MNSIFEKYGLAVPTPEDLAPVPGPGSIPEPDAKAQEWAARRVGMITASQFGKINLTKTGGFYQGTDSYLNEKLAEWCTGMATPNSAEYSKAVQWGRQYEKQAVQQFQSLIKKKITCYGEQQRFFQLKGYPLIGGTPDGLVGRDGVLEIKCPYNFANHARTVLSGQVPDEYLDQVNGHLLLTGRKVCYYVSFDPRFSICPVMVVKVERNERDIEELKARLIKAHDELQERLKKLKINWRELRRERLEKYKQQ